MIFAALRYFLLIFALGFLLGTARELVTARALGQTWALILELPVMLLASIMIAGQSMTMYKVQGPLRALGMGLCALVLLLAAEAMLAWLFYRQRPLIWLNVQLRWPAILGFSAQIAFGLVPLLVSFTRGLRFRL